MTQSQLVTIGRTVHYVLPGNRHRAAIVVDVVVGDVVDLCIFLAPSDPENALGKEPTGWGRRVPYSDDVVPPADTWHWPERA